MHLTESDDSLARDSCNIRASVQGTPCFASKRSPVTDIELLPLRPVHNVSKFSSTCSKPSSGSSPQGVYGPRLHKEWNGYGQREALCPGSGRVDVYKRSEVLHTRQPTASLPLYTMNTFLGSMLLMHGTDHRCAQVAQTQIWPEG